MIFNCYFIKLRISITVQLWLILFPFLLLSQKENAHFQHLNIENGLSNNSINSIVQDDEGYIWIATDDGLNKFNGYSSKVFYPNKPDSIGNLKTFTGCAFKDSKGRLWFGGDGLILCDPTKEIFKVFKYDVKNSGSISNNDVFKIVEDESSNIWIGTRIGLNRYNETTQDFTRFNNDFTGTAFDLYCRNRIIDMAPDHKGNLWMAMLCGLYQFSLKTNNFTPFLLENEKMNSHLTNQSKALCLDQCGMIWIQYFDKGIFQFDPDLKKYKKIIFPNDEMNQASMRINAMVCDVNNNIWIATDFNGLLYFNCETNNWEHFKHDIFNFKSIAENKLNCFFEDRSGIMWIGTTNKGADRIKMGQEKFSNYILQPGKSGSLCADDITCFHEDEKNHLWIGSKNGLMHFDPVTKKFECYQHDSKNSNSISHNCIYSIDLDSLNNLWIATENGLNYLDIRANQWTRYQHKETDLNGLPSRNVYDVRIRKNGEVWLATSGLICRFDPESQTFENRHNNPAIENLYHAFYFTIFEDSHQEIWASTARSGIYKIDNQFKIVKSYRKSGGFQANMVHQFEEDKYGTLWMASDMGIYFKKQGKDSIYKLSSTSGVLNGDIKSIVIDKDGNFWVSTLMGLVKFSLDQNEKIQTFRIFTDSDGLQSKAFNTFAGIRLHSGELCFGGINGFNIFNPAAIQLNNYIPPIKFTSFKVENQEIPLEEFTRNDASINLNYDQNDFSFEMAALNYNNVAMNQYAYQLEGYDKKLIYSGTNRIAQYTNVPPGKYLLKIFGSNNDSIWNKSGYSLYLTIHPPYWKTLWFRLFLLLFLGLTSSLLYSQKVKSIQKQEKDKAEVEKKIAEARSMALRAQMNPHFIFNSLNSIQHLISESAKEDAHKYLSKFSKLMRLVLEHSSKPQNTIASEFEMLNLYLEMESLRFENKFTYNIQIEKNPNLLASEIPSMLLHPFVENAVIHGLLNKPEAGHLQISIHQQLDRLICVIEDDGIGRIAAEKIKNNKINSHISLGMQVTEDRIKMIETITKKRAQIKIEDLLSPDGKAAGTRVIIEIPIEFMA